MRKQSLPKPERLTALLLTFALFAAGCVAAPEPTTVVPTTSTMPPTGTTTGPDRCPEPFCVVYSIRRDATWSDGVPVTAADFIHTYELQAAEDGYQLITRVEEVDDKTVLFAFSDRYGPWRHLFGAVLPAHVDDPLSVSAGPFILDQAAESLVMTANPDYWGERGGIQRVDFLPIDSVRDGLRRLDSGALDMIFPPSLDWVLEELDDMDHVVRHTVSGAVWEQIAFNFDNPLLAELWVREAINLAVDRSAILDATLRTVVFDEVPLNSSIWPDAASWYEPVFPEAWNPSRAVEILSDQGCVPGEDGIHVCGGEPLDFTFVTTVGDPWRRAHFEILRDQLAEVGINLEGIFLPPDELFASDFFFGGHDRWDMLGFPWQFSEELHLGTGRFACEGTAPNGYGALNVNRYCNLALDDLVAAARVETDLRGTRDLYREMDRIYLADLAVIPLYQRPTTIAWNRSISGPHVNLSTASHLWSIATWSGMEEVRIGVERLPETLDLLTPGNAALILAPISAGAYTVDPSFRFVPELIESAEVTVGES